MDEKQLQFGETLKIAAITLFGEQTLLVILNLWMESTLMRCYLIAHTILLITLYFVASRLSEGNGRQNTKQD